MARPFSPLPLYLASAYSLLAIYGSLYPLTDWRHSGAPLTAFLGNEWPRYTTTFDIAINVGAYLPLGFLWVAALRQRLTPLAAVGAAVLIGTTISLGMEVLQNFLPSRVPSNLDLACNAMGALAGALAGAVWGRSMLDGGRLDSLRRRWFVAGKMPDAGLLLIWLWLLTQFNPDTLLFGNGSLRSLLDVPAPLDYSAGSFVRIEAAIVGAHTLAIALIVSLLARPWHPGLAPGIVGAGLAAKSFALLLMMHGSAGLAWATPGSVGGLVTGLLLWFLATPLQPRWQRALAALALLVATTLVNIAPENPYLAHTYQTWNPGQFLNFHGLTQLASNLWPFLALPWLILTRTDNEL
ncbi:MAG: VanZ family protein [Gammaproteobacteria bacterium]|nr:VanZ family protein [Gammaproteobacteria bacterium]MBU1416249.1 VanZ family protein [Gammaproteobacteria bacterium]